MIHSGRVVWSEGMFLHPQHFQQQDRWAEGLVRAATYALRHYGWGFHHLEIEQGLLAQGKIVVRRAAGVMPDGTAFAIPDDCAAPGPLEIDAAAGQAVVHLVLAATPAGSAEIDLPEAEPTGARYTAREIEIRDNIAHADSSAALHVAEPRFRLMYGLVPSDAYVHLPVARIATLLTDGTLVLDEEFLVPCLRFGVSPYLAGVIQELVGKLGSIARDRAAYVTGKRAQSSGDLADFMVLQLCNRYLASARHLAAQRATHPEDLYRWMLEFVGEASSFIPGDLVAPIIEPYRHAEPWLGFRPLVAEIRRVLLELGLHPGKAIQLPLTLFPSGAYGAEVHDISLFTEASFYLAVQANASPDDIRHNLPGQIKVGPAEDLRHLVNSAVPGIALRHVPNLPREIPVRRQMVYFDFDQNSDYWRRLLQSAGLTIHVTGDLQDGLELECWAIRS